MFRTARLSYDPPLWLRFFTLLLGAAVWLCGVVGQLYVLLIWLVERAGHEERSERVRLVSVPSGLLAFFKYIRVLPPLLLGLVFVVLPLADMPARAPSTAQRSRAWRGENRVERIGVAVRGEAGGRHLAAEAKTLGDVLGSGAHTRHRSSRGHRIGTAPVQTRHI